MLLNFQMRWLNTVVYSLTATLVAVIRLGTTVKTDGQGGQLLSPAARGLPLESNHRR